MIPVTTFAGQKVAVHGLGASGLSVARALVAGGASVQAWDDGAPARAAAVAAGVAVGDLSTADWSRFAALVLAPGVPLTHPAPHWTVALARAAGVEVIGDIELFFRERARHAPGSQVVCITGTNGKSTTTALVSHLLTAAGRDVAMGGNIGMPVLDLAPPAAGRIHVIELSSFQIDLTPSLAPSIGVLLNLSPDHLDRHGPGDDTAAAMARYAGLKERLVAAAAHAVIGCDDELSSGIADRLAARGVPITRLATAIPTPGKGECFIAEGTRICRRTPGTLHAEPIGDLAGIGSLRGRHNMQNALAALAVVGVAFPGTPVGGHLAACHTFPGLPHRMEEVGRLGRLVFINDSKATNADSTEKALAAFPRDIYWILGGKPKEGGIAALAPYFSRVARAYLIGAASDTFAETLDGAVPFERCGTLDAALENATRDAMATGASEPVVLLSPACASYDQFKSFVHRGDVFRDLVQARIRREEEPASGGGAG